MASYTQIAKGNWKATVSLGFDSYGKRLRQKKQGFTTKKAAEKWVTDILNKKHTGYITTTNSNVTLKDFITKWFYEYKIHTASVTTISNYQSRINSHIIPKLGHLKLNNINTIIVQDFYNGLINEGLKPSSAKKTLESLSNCLRYAYRNKLIHSLPTDIEKVPIEKPKINYWTKDEINYYLNEISNTYLYPPVYIALLTGLRVGELCGLRWCDIDFTKNYLTVNNQVLNDKMNKKLIFTDKLKTTTSRRKIILPDILINYLKEIKGDNPNNNFVILDRKNQMCNPRNLSMNFTKSISKYKLTLDVLNELKPNKDLNNYMQLTQITFHALRHTHATQLISNGANIKVVSERLGHKSITETLDTYTHVIDDMNTTTANILNNMF
ncbi:site-specific integrase [Clostridium botulinum]|uniref:site-specific integrase n=1 Tax=Clostridium botulinum TaxID=1491 RepID=UPI0006A6FBE4|nr:site-specific integrase [Clostridium botulinum]KAI3350113.1 site-specific integrase [Clostridium botulinum]KOM88933.1 integrase [Clostridium botulinum]KOR63499.1 integrase [Clostridium botulinum]MCS6111511.1 site-specific integrase [Clostridium botulinum]NFE10931.1 site-specific integrase [Clostridium botulinum]